MVRSIIHPKWIFAVTLLAVTARVSATVPGEAIYQGTCIACHGANGKGTLPGVPDLNDPKGVLSKPYAELMKSITNGLRSPGSPLSMPPKGGDPSLNKKDIEAVIHYMRKTFGSR